MAKGKYAVRKATSELTTRLRNKRITIRDLEEELADKRVMNSALFNANKQLTDSNLKLNNKLVISTVTNLGLIAIMLIKVYMEYVK